MENTINKRTLLKEYFGYTDFRPGQEDLISSILSGRDVLGVMPTGAGKSMCYQLPALLLPGITLVVSPLISLMKDQVNALTQAGIPAAYLNSSLSDEQYREAFRRARSGKYKIIYVAPERMETESFIRFAEDTRISLVAVDEAHCVSQWGQDFRPSYLKIVKLIEHLSYRPIIGAFTATATTEVKIDIIRILKLNDPLSVTTGFDRANLYFEVSKPKNKAQYLRKYISMRPNSSGIVFCATRAAVERVCEDLKNCGLSATRYHAGLEDGERQQNQEDFIYDRYRVMVATNAFGMGIDKSNVSFVIHFNMPKNLESYYQEAGRAGRDGTPADCILLYSGADVQTAKFLIQNSEENTDLSEEARELVFRRDMERLNKMIAYCKTNVCLRTYILEYFGETRLGSCSNCSNCNSEYINVDITTEAQKILSCVARVDKTRSYGLGASLYEHVLRGSKAQKISQLGLDKLPTYGIMSNVAEQKILDYIDFLITTGYLQSSTDDHPVLHLTEKSSEVLFQNEQVIMAEKKPAAAITTGTKQTAKSSFKTKPGLDLSDMDSDLLSALKALRTKLARDAGVPSYIVFSNTTLDDMAEKRPKTIEELLEVSGVGEVKAERYGKKFLQAISEFL